MVKRLALLIITNRDMGLSYIRLSLSTLFAGVSGKICCSGFGDRFSNRSLGRWRVQGFTIRSLLSRWRHINRNPTIVGGVAGHTIRSILARASQATAATSNQNHLPVIGITSASLEAVSVTRRPGGLLRLALQRRVYAFRQQGAGFIAAVAGDLQSDLGVCPHGTAALPPNGAETPPPTPVLGSPE